MNPTSPKPTAQTVGYFKNRRAWMLGTAGLAGAAGAALAWHQWQRPLQVPSQVASPVEGFWAMQWQTPQNQTLRMQSFQGQPLLLNFWATWCPPCVEELPRLNAFYRRNASAGWGVLGLALDHQAAVLSFLGKMPLDFPVGLAGLAGIELSRGLGNLAGGLPFSVVIGADGQVLHRKMGPVADADLAAWIRLK
jgi:thiol-disulfide isomerase/thioredoxin